MYGDNISQCNPKHLISVADLLRLQCDDQPAFAILAFKSLFHRF
jgi:hypothetical protein